MKHFIIKELVPPEVWEAEGERALAHFDERILVSIEQIRSHFNVPVTINNWHLGGQFKYRGYRPQSCNVGAKRSLHRSGGALDFDVRDFTADQVRREIIKRQDKFHYVKRLEDKVNWVHIDIKDTGRKEILLFGA